MTLAELGRLVDARVEGDGSLRITGVATLRSAGPGELSFLANSKYRRYLAETRAGAVVVDESSVAELHTSALVHANPYATFARAARLLAPDPSPAAGVHPSAVVDDSARIAPGVHVGPRCIVGAGTEIAEGCILHAGAIVGDDCRIGEGTVLKAGVILADRVALGRGVRVHSGAVIGSDGFGFARDGDEWVRVPQLGGVRVGDHADIGANTTVDRGALEDTVIGAQVKLDNLVQIGHNCDIGERTVIAGQAGVAGSTTIGRDCMIGGACAIGGHIRLGDGVVVTGGSNVANSIDGPGVFSSTTTPVETNRSWRRNAVRFTQLDDMARRLRALERGTDEKEG
ncbi:UDP-3-O-(3-hydroxymyristoyl)glucosamine N-acyltransferase [Ectothiorhodospiraceae bacterium WFHF3C12]|nr:UDP-3-O-(3-hydroxymyristoyl)glucosamine N-acyltransferase [Ectothiorhodospiraceae bacterium WFHF3C12]